MMSITTVPYTKTRDSLESAISQKIKDLKSVLVKLQTMTDDFPNLQGESASFVSYLITKESLMYHALEKDVKRYVGQQEK